MVNWHIVSGKVGAVGAVIETKYSYLTNTTKQEIVFTFPFFGVAMISK